MMKGVKVLGMLAIAAAILILSSCSGGTKTAYVELSVIYDKFPLKKQLETKLQNTQNARKAIVDSLNLSLRAKAGIVTENSSEAEKKEFLLEKRTLVEKKQYFDEDNSRQSKEYNDQIWKQINQYVKDYGEEKGYDYIFGAEGSGTLMYGAKKNNITEDVSAYVNKRFAGGKN